MKREHFGMLVRTNLITGLNDESALLIIELATRSIGLGSGLLQDGSAGEKSKRCAVSSWSG
jgi:hypothetical protein